MTPILKNRIARPLGFVILAALVVVGTYLLFGSISDWLDEVLGDGEDENIPETIFFVILGIFTCAAALSRRDQPFSSTLAIGPLRFDRVMLQSFGLCIALFLFERATIAAGLYGAAVGVRSRSIEETTLFGALNSVILAPVIEEALFRGLLFTGLRNHLGLIWALLISATAFAGFHFENGPLFMLFILPTGFVLGYVREWSGNISLGILLHALMNGFVSVLGLLRSYNLI